MKVNVGFVGFDGTECKRTIPAIHQVKEAERIEGDMNVLLRSPHARAKSMLAKFTKMCNVIAFLTDEKDRAVWESVGTRIEGGYDDFFEESDVIIVGTPEGHELPYVEASIAHDCNIMLMGGAQRGDILNGLAEKNIGITEKVREDLGREFFFGLGNYDRFLKAAPKLVQCTSCNTTSLCRTVLAASPIGLCAVLGNLDRRSGDPQNIVKMSPNAIQFGSDVGHQGRCSNCF
jgi:glyceraldehyde-3-phosphate dehydrogenase (NAD(P))